MTTPLELIASRRRQIEAELALLSEQMEPLRAELADLEAAERVLSRLSVASGNQASPTIRPPAAAQPAPHMDATKPPGTPTITNMIVEALVDAKQRGRVGLEPKGMTEYIQAKWWPNVPGVAISPIAWRMWKRGMLEKEDTLYKLPRNAEAADLLSSAGSAASRPIHQH